MCLNTIETENVIFNYFENNKEKKEVDLSTLSVYVRKIDRKFRDENKRVYIDYTRSSLAKAIDLHFDILRQVDNKISLRVTTIPPNQIKLVNSKIPNSIKSEYLHFFTLTNQEIKKEEGLSVHNL